MNDPVLQQLQTDNAAAVSFVERTAVVPRAPFMVVDLRPPFLNVGTPAQVPTSVEPAPKAPDPRRVPLPLGGVALMYTREQLVYMYRCSHGELGRLLRAKMAPLPVRIDGGIYWYVDEVLGTQATVERTVTRWRKR